MQTADLFKNKAIKLYPNLDSSHKKLLDDIFDQKTFQSPIDRIKTFEDACKDQGENPADPRFTSLGTSDEIAYRRLKVMRDALVGIFVPDWNNGSQYKWAPWFYMDSPGFRFLGSLYVAGYARVRRLPALLSYREGKRLPWSGAS